MKGWRRSLSTIALRTWADERELVLVLRETPSGESILGISGRQFITLGLVASVATDDFASEHLEIESTAWMATQHTRLLLDPVTAIARDERERGICIHLSLSTASSDSIHYDGLSDLTARDWGRATAEYKVAASFASLGHDSWQRMRHLGLYASAAFSLIALKRL